MINLFYKKLRDKCAPTHTIPQSIAIYSILFIYYKIIHEVQKYTVMQINEITPYT